METRKVVAEPLPRTQEGEKFLVEKMMSIIDRSRLSGASGKIFNSLFPPGINNQLFNKASIVQHTETEYNIDEKAVADLCLEEMGYLSTKKIVESGSRHALDRLRVGFDHKKPEAFVNVLNDLPFVSNLREIGQTGPHSSMTRAQHSMHLANTVARDVYRMAIKTPELFIERVKTDMRRLGFSYETLTKNQTYSAELLSLSSLQYEAVNVAINYSRYLTLYAYLHDEMTPAFGDTVMKAKARPGNKDQKSIKYSEDTALMGSIKSKIFESDLLPVLQQFKMDPDLMIILTTRLSSEGDSTLGSQLMKNKRDYKKDDETISEALRKLTNQKSFDRDQESGTVANMQDIADLLMPGGFAYMYKRDNLEGDLVKDLKKKKNSTPIGSFENRMMLLAYSLATGTNLTEELSKIGFQEADLNDIYIAAEEFTIGPNFQLMKAHWLNNEIIPVALEPGDIKRLLLAFNTLTYFHYQSDQRSGVERMVQDILTTINTHADVLDWFTRRTDYSAQDYLINEKKITIIGYILSHYLPKMQRVTEEELKELMDQNPGHILHSPAQVFGSDYKPGTLVRAMPGKEGEEIQQHIEVLNRSFDKDRQAITKTEKELSLPKRLKNVDEALKQEKFHHCIILTGEEINELGNQIDSTGKEFRKDVMDALEIWGFSSLR